MSFAEIKGILSKHQIATLDDLTLRSRPVLDVLRDDSILVFYVAVHDALEKNKKTLEAVLDGKLIYDKSCIGPDSHGYVQGAVSVDTTAIPLRGNPFTLVLGPSGSGKTHFALWWLTIIIRSHYAN